MEKENKILLITKQAQKLHNQGKVKIKHTHVFDLNSQKRKKELKKKIIQTKKLKVYIFDITYNTKEKDKSRRTVNDHINKTGQNILIGKNRKFIDISKLYVQEKEGIITTCLGKRYSKEKKQHIAPTTDLCHAAIWCKKQNPKIKIYGKTINVKQENLE